MEREPNDRSRLGLCSFGSWRRFLGKHRKEGRLRTFALGLPSRRVLLLLEEEGS